MRNNAKKRLRFSQKSFILPPVRKLYSLTSKTISKAARYAEATATRMVRARKIKVQVLLEPPISQKK